MTIQFNPRWNNASLNQTCICANVTDIASGSASTLLDLRVNGVSSMSVDKTGLIATSGSITTPSSVYITNSSLLNIGRLSQFNNSLYLDTLQNGNIYFRTGFGTSVPLTLNGAGITGGASNNVVAIVSSTTAQTLQVYNTYTSATNFENLQQSWSSNEARIGTTVGSTGGTQRNLVLGAWDSSSTWIPKVVITPTSTGAFYLGGVADNSSTNGNARGNYAIDLQLIRSSAGQVAGAHNSVAIGCYNTVSSTNGSVAIGWDNAATGGGNGKTIAIGRGNTASGEYSIAIGAHTTASNSGCIVMSNEFGSATASGAMRIGPAGGTASGTCSIALGGTVSTSRVNEVAWGFRHSLFGVKPGHALLTCKTTDATPTPLRGNNIFSTNSAWTFTSGTIASLTMYVLGSKSDGSAIARYTRQIIIKNVGDTITLVESQTIGTDYEDNAATDLTVSATTPFFNVTGITGETWRWVAWFSPMIELDYGT